MTPFKISFIFRSYYIMTKDKDAYADITEAVEAEYDWTDTYFLLKVQDWL